RPRFPSAATARRGMPRSPARAAARAAHMKMRSACEANKNSQENPILTACPVAAVNFAQAFGKIATPHLARKVKILQLIIVFPAGCSFLATVFAIQQLKESGNGIIVSKIFLMTSSDHRNTAMIARSLFALLSFSALTFSAHAQEEPAAILAINEGVTYQDAGTPSERYKPLLEMLSKELKRPIRIKTVSRYSEFDKDLAAGRYELVFIHPAHVGLQAVQRGNYHGIATAKGFTGYRARVMVPKDSSLTRLEDLQGKKIGVPSIESITTAMFTAHLKEHKFTEPEKAFQATRYQDA